MELKVGQTITCIKDYQYVGEMRFTEGKEYNVKEINAMYIGVIDDTNSIFYLYEEFAEYFTTEPPQKERYFIVFYKTDVNQGGMDIIQKDGNYINYSQTIKDIKNSVKNAKETIITNIIELNQQDYESWNK